MNRVLVNGVETEYVSVQDRGLQYGDGLFETMLCHGHSLYYWPQHYRRLQQSAARLAMDCPREDLLLDDIARLLAGCDNSTGAVKIILTRGNSNRGYAFQQGRQGRRIVQFSALPESYPALLSQRLETGRLFVCRTQAGINESLAGLKHLNRLENVMARSEFGADYLDGLMLDAGGHVIEGCMSNLFGIREAALYTPDLSGSGVNGIMRERIMSIIKPLNYPLHVQAMTLEDVANMDALFISNSLIGIREVTAIASPDMETGFKSSAITGRIFEALLADSRDARHRV